MKFKLPLIVILLVFSQSFFAQKSKTDTANSESAAFSAKTEDAPDFKKQMQDLKDQEKAYLAKLEAEKKAATEAKVKAAKEEATAAKAKADADKNVTE